MHDVDDIDNDGDKLQNDGGTIDEYFIRGAKKVKVMLSHTHFRYLVMVAVTKNNCG